MHVAQKLDWSTETRLFNFSKIAFSIKRSFQRKLKTKSFAAKWPIWFWLLRLQRLCRVIYSSRFPAPFLNFHRDILILFFSRTITHTEETKKDKNQITPIMSSSSELQAKKFCHMFTSLFLLVLLWQKLLVKEICIILRSVWSSRS